MELIFLIILIIGVLVIAVPLLIVAIAAWRWSIILVCSLIGSLAGLWWLGMFFGVGLSAILSLVVAVAEHAKKADKTR